MCALRELLQWRNYAGLYEGCQLRSAEGEVVHMKARLRAQEAFGRLGNWGQVRWAPPCSRTMLLHCYSEGLSPSARQRSYAMSCPQYADWS